MRETIGPTNFRLRGPDMAPHPPYASRPPRLCLFGFELGPAGVEELYSGAGGVERGVAVLQRRGIGGDRGVFRRAPACLDRRLRVEDRALHAVPLALLQVAKALRPRALPLGAARRRRGRR